MNQNGSKGFTLIELMVVIAIISILAAVSAPTFESHIAKANLVDVQLYASSTLGQIDEFVLTHSAFPTSSEFEDFKTSHSNIDLIKSATLSKLDKLQGSVTIIFNSDIGINEDTFIKYSRSSNSIWSCETSLNAQLSPEQCVIKQ